MQNPTFEKNKDRKFISIPIDINFVSLRGISPKRLRFQIEYALERGTTTNSFLIGNLKQQSNNDTPIFIIHPPSGSFGTLFIEKLKLIIPCKDKKLFIIIFPLKKTKVHISVASFVREK